MVGIVSLFHLFTFSPLTVVAQTSVSDELRADVLRAAGMHYSLPLTEPVHDTPAPQGKKPFFINHYGCPSAYYPENIEYLDAPYLTLTRADSLGKLTNLGCDVLARVEQLRREARDRTSELTEAGKQQARRNAQLLVQQFPEVFTDECNLDARSIVENHCLLTMCEAFVEMARAHEPMKLHSNASRRDQSWMNPQDSRLENRRRDSLAMVRYNEYAARWAPDDSQLMALLFNDADYAKTVDAAALSRQLFDLASSTQYSEKVNYASLFSIFTPEAIHRHWMRRNAWAYIRYGGCTLNGGYQPYTQRQPLWGLIHLSDSIMQLDDPVVKIRYTHENVVMSLVCLLELDGYGLQTDCLDSLEALGWADYRIAPLGGSIVMVHYRSGKDDPDPLVRILLNGREARLPIPTDCAPYYHWNDVKRYYLRKLYVYTRERNDN